MAKKVKKYDTLNYVSFENILVSHCNTGKGKLMKTGLSMPPVDDCNADNIDKYILLPAPLGFIERDVYFNGSEDGFSRFSSLDAAACSRMRSGKDPVRGFVLSALKSKKIEECAILTYEIFERLLPQMLTPDELDSCLNDLRRVILNDFEIPQEWIWRLGKTEDSGDKYAYLASIYVCALSRDTFPKILHLDPIVQKVIGDLDTEKQSAYLLPLILSMHKAKIEYSVDENGVGVFHEYKSGGIYTDTDISELILAAVRNEVEIPDSHMQQFSELRHYILKSKTDEAYLAGGETNIRKTYQKYFGTDDSNSMFLFIPENFVELHGIYVQPDGKYMLLCYAKGEDGEPITMQAEAKNPFEDE